MYMGENYLVLQEMSSLKRSINVDLWWVHHLRAHKTGSIPPIRLHAGFG